VSEGWIGWSEGREEVMRGWRGDGLNRRQLPVELPCFVRGILCCVVCPKSSCFPHDNSPPGPRTPGLLEQSHCNLDAQRAPPPSKG